MICYEHNYTFMSLLVFFNQLCRITYFGEKLYSGVQHPPREVVTPQYNIPHGKLYSAVQHPPRKVVLRPKIGGYFIGKYRLCSPEILARSCKPHNNF